MFWTFRGLHKLHDSHVACMAGGCPVAGEGCASRDPVSQIRKEISNRTNKSNETKMSIRKWDAES